MLSRLLLHLLCLAALSGGAAVAQTPAQVVFSDTSLQYSGAAKFPTVTTVPAGLQVELSLAPRVSSTVYNSIPAALDLSYSGTPLYGSTSKALGDIVGLAGTNRYLESVDVVLVNWAKASDWPALATQNPQGYYHPVTVFIYRRNADQSLTVLGQKNQQVLIPWRPATLGDGSVYPYGGKSVKIRFNFPMGLALSESLAVMVAFNTQTTGFEPIGVDGPYNSLNVALGSSVPSVGTNVDPATMLRYTTGFVSTSSFGALSPMFEIRAYATNSTSGFAINPGVYYVNATIIAPGYAGSGSTDFTIVPAPATVTLSNLKQGTDGTPKPVTVTTNPSGLSYSILYAGQSTAPSVAGNYPVIVNITSANWSGQATGNLVLGRSFSTWRQKWLTAGTLNSSNSALLNDADSDGLNNLLEYAMGLDPTIPGAGSLIIQDMGPSVAVTYRRQESTIDLTYEIQASDGLVSPSVWSTTTGAESIVSTIEGIQTVKVTITKPLSDIKRFYRLKITKNDSL